MTQPAQPQPKKTSGVTILLIVVGGCFAFSLLMAVGQTLGYGGVALGLLAVGGGGYLLVKGPPERRKLAAGGIALGVLFIVFGLMGAGASRRKAEAEAAATAAAQRKAADDKAGLEKAVAQLAALDANAAPNQLVAVCSDVLKLGSIPAQYLSRCGDGFLAEGKVQLAAKHPSEAVALLEQAAKLSSKKDDAAAALSDAKVALQAEAGTAATGGGKKALEGNDPTKAATVAEAPTAKDKWEDPAFVRFEVYKEWCPKDFWAVLKVPAPGSDEFERKSHEDKRAELAKTIRATTYVADLNDFELSEYDFKKQQFVLSVATVFFCKIEDVGSTSVALAPAKVGEDRTGMMRGEENIAGRAVWRAEPLRFVLKVPEKEAKQFREDNAKSFKVEVAFKVIGSDQHKVMVRNQFNDKEDVGAGSLLKATPLGVRVVAADEKVPRVDTLPEPKR